MMFSRVSTVSKSLLLRSIYNTNKLTKKVIQDRSYLPLITSQQRFLSNKPSFLNKNDENKQHQQNQEDNENLTTKKTGILGSMVLGGSILFGKAKYLLFALKVTKLSSVASLLLSSAAYGYIFGWPYGIGMVGLIFVHESGHALAMHYHNIPFTPMVFIPFVGASVGMEEHPINASVEAKVAIAGPIFGSLAALSLGILGDVTNSQLLLALADWGYMINMFNLLPIGTLDGGRILGAISPLFGVLGVGAGAGLLYSGAITNPLMYLIVLGGAYQSVSRFMGWSTQSLPPNYYNISRATQFGIFTSYAALVAFLIVAIAANNRKRKSPKQLQREQQYSEETWEQWNERQQSQYRQLEQWQQVLDDDEEEI